MQFDLIVVGGGLAGLVAANRAAELGRNVAVLEQGEDLSYLCNSRVATGIFNFAHSDPESDVESLVEAIQADTEGHADLRIAHALARTAGRGLTWLRGEGAEFVQQDRPGRRPWVLAPGRSKNLGLDWQGRGPDQLVRKLGDNLKRRGGQLILGAQARSLIMTGDTCCGVVADHSGKSLAFKAEAVILADGGFQNNLEMVGRYISPNPQALVQRSAGTSFGTAIEMAAAIGAKLVDMDRFYGHLLSQAAFENTDYWPYPSLDSLGGGSILINRAGQRFADEGLGGITLSNIIAQLEDPRSTMIVFDNDIWNSAGREENVPPNPTLLSPPGALIMADDLPTLARKIDVPASAFIATVESYNRAIETGAAHSLTPSRTAGRRFGVRRDSSQRVPPTPIQTPPFFCAPVAVGITCTTGGIAIDENARALRVDGKPISGLYAVGSTTGGLEGGPAAGYIGGLAKAYCLGLIAAEHLALASP